LIKAETPEGQTIKVLKDLHFSMIRTLTFLPHVDLVVSSDQQGMIEIWDPETYDFPSDGKRVTFDFISGTDLMSLVKAKTFAMSCTYTESLLAFYCRDRKIRVFSLKTGKLLRTLDETLQMYIEQH
jgi:peptidylprolyl isomerase domain and WD repeat-containing protein 1